MIPVSYLVLVLFSTIFGTTGGAFVLAPPRVCHVLHPDGPKSGGDSRRQDLKSRIIGARRRAADRVVIQRADIRRENSLRGHEKSDAGYEPRCPNTNALMRSPRIYVGTEGVHLHVGQIVDLNPEQTRYLLTVMRLRDGSTLRVFDGVSGEFWATVCEGSADRARRRYRSTEHVQLRVEGLTRPQHASGSIRRGVDADVQTPALEVMFAPIRKQRMKMLVEKAVEVGVSRLTPVLTARTQISSADTSALRKLGVTTAIEAVEQCERMTVPPVGITPVTLLSLLQSLKATQSNRESIARVHPTGTTSRQPSECAGAPCDAIMNACEHEKVIFVCKERDLDSPPILKAFADYAQEFGHDLDHSAVLLVGPEGGFDPEEIDALAACPFVRFVSLGSSVLRAETAVIYALSCWSAFWAARDSGRGRTSAVLPTSMST